MLRFQDKKIATKIGVIIGLFSALLILCTGVSLLGLAKNEKLAQDVIGDQEKTLYLAAAAAAQGSELNRSAFEIGVETDAQQWPNLQAVFQKRVADLQQSMMALKPVLDGEIEVTLSTIITENLVKYVDLEVNGYGLRTGGQLKAYEDLLQNEMAAVFATMDGALKKLAAKQDMDMAQAGIDIHAAASATMWQTLALSAAGLLIVIVGALVLVKRQIAGPLTALTSTMGKLAGGDTAMDIVGQTRKDEIGALASALQVFKQAAIDKLRIEGEADQTRRHAAGDRTRNDAERATAEAEQTLVVEGIATGLECLSGGDLMFRLDKPFAPHYDKLRVNFNGAMEKLQDTMKVVTASSSAIRSGTNEISSALNDLSKRTENQAASLEETAAALDEITATVRKTAEGSRHARQVVGQAKIDAEYSGKVVQKAVESMSGIERSSDQIGQIIGVIDEIAFQTNLLALNAGVEAARAGDAGRGFAVVASEVRALAQRSANAAKEIKALISASSAQVEQGVDLVGQTGEALVRIVAQVAEINGIVGEIAASAQDQATGLDQVNTAINQMDQVTQQNAAMVEQSTAASQALSKETEDLSHLIDRFQVGQGVAVAPGRQIRKTAQAVRIAASTMPIAALRTVGRGGAARKPELSDES